MGIEDLISVEIGPEIISKTSKMVFTVTVQRVE